MASQRGYTPTFGAILRDELLKKARESQRSGDSAEGKPALSGEPQGDAGADASINGRALPSE
jgi:hypothetical protein